MNTENQVGSNAPQIVHELPKLHEEHEKKAQAEPRGFGTGSNAFTTFYTWRGNGVVQNLNFSHSSINANSRVFVNISEFGSDAAQNRFIGGARMAVYNIAPYNGGFHAWVEVSWNYPLPVRFDVLIDP